MGYAARTVLCLTLCLAVSAAIQARDENSGMHAMVKDYILPQYRQSDNHLQFVIFGDNATNKGSQVFLNHVKIDILHSQYGTLESASIFLPGIGERIPAIYPLNAAKNAVRKFWSHPKQKSVRAWVFCNDAVFDKSTNILRSEDNAFFRSREINVDGVGFDAYHEKKMIHIRARVSAVIQAEVFENLNQSNESSADMQKQAWNFYRRKNEPMKITSDILDLDIEKNTAILTGNVKVDDQFGKITCDKLSIYLTESQDPQDEKENSEDDMTEGRKLSRIEFDGHVEIVPAPEKTNNRILHLNSDHAVYNVNKETIIFSGNPKVREDENRLDAREITYFTKKGLIRISRAIFYYFGVNNIQEKKE